MIRMETLPDPSLVDWNDRIAQLPGAHILQTSQWAEVKKTNGWQPVYIQWKDDYGAIVAAVVIHRKQVPILSRISRTCLLYAPRGPLVDWEDKSIASRVLEDLEEFARVSGAIFLKIDPDLPVGWDLENKPNPGGVAIEQTLSVRGWNVSGEQIQFRNTILLDLTLAEDDLLQRMKQKTRYNIRLAERKGVTVRIGVNADFSTLYRMYAETANRDGFVIRTREYYLDVWSRLLQDGMATPLIAEINGEPVSGIVLFHFAGRAYYFYGMSTEKYREWMPNHLIQWRAIQYAKSIGCKVYDFWGAPDHFDESDSMYGVYRFKDGFSGQIVRGLSAWDYSSRPGWYRFYTKTMPHFLDLLRSAGRRRVKSEVRP